MREWDIKDEQKIRDGERAEQDGDHLSLLHDIKRESRERGCNSGLHGVPLLHVGYYTIFWYVCGCEYFLWYAFFFMLLLPTISFGSITLTFVIC